MLKADVLEKATELITGDREGDYGDVRKNFEDIAALWSVTLGVKVQPWQAAVCMSQLKVARLIKTPDHEDSWCDAAGYMGIGGELATELPVEPMPDWERELLMPHVGQLLRAAEEFARLPLESLVAYDGSGHPAYHWEKVGEDWWRDSDPRFARHAARTNAQMASASGRTLLRIGGQA